MRKRKSFGLVMAFIIGIVAVIIAILMLIIARRIKNPSVDGKILVYRLNQPVVEGEMIDGSKIESVYVDEYIVPDNSFCNDVGDDYKYTTALSKGTILTNNMINQVDMLDDDIRLQNFPYVELPNKLQVGDYVDIRIAFGNGYDYVLLAKKRVEDFTLFDSDIGVDNSLWIDVSEEELLMMSGAVVDASFSEGSRIYAIAYKNNYQDKAIVNYPVSASIEALIENDPNIVERASKAMSENIRQELENGIKADDTSEEDNKKGDRQEDGNQEDTKQNNYNQDDLLEDQDDLLEDQDDLQDIIFFD